MDIQEELEFHPALLALVCAIIEQCYPVKIQRRIIELGGTILWTEPPRIVDGATPEYRGDGRYEADIPQD